MKKIFIPLYIFLIVLISINFLYLNNKIETSNPTMDEWLEVYITKNINNITDLYTLKTETKVHIFNTNSNGGNLYPKEIVILVTPPNYEIENFTEQQKNEYTKLAKESAESIIENYGIKKDYVIKVKFLD